MGSGRHRAGPPHEGPRGGFQHGGWAQPCNDPVMGKVAGEGMANTGAMLLGRRTYEDFYAYWPKQTNNPSPRS
jgi:dihydrofolate reductase